MWWQAAYNVKNDITSGEKRQTFQLFPAIIGDHISTQRADYVDISNSHETASGEVFLVTVTGDVKFKYGFCGSQINPSGFT